MGDTAQIGRDVGGNNLSAAFFDFQRLSMIRWRSPSFQLSAGVVFAKIFVLRKCVGDRIFFSKIFTAVDVRIVMLRVRLGRVRFVTHHGIITLN